MNDRPLQLALRDWRQEMMTPLAATIMGGVVIMLTIMLPFGVDRQLGVFGRLAYWAGVVFTTYSMGAIINSYLRIRYRHQISRFVLCVLVSIATGIVVTITVVTINIIALDYLPRGTEAVMYVASIGAIAIIVAVLFFLLTQATVDQSDQPPRILDRLPFEKRGALLSLTVEDHYVRVTTTKGTEVILMRLRDAILETAPTDGFQVHRSHWVANDAIAALQRDGDRTVLKLRNDDLVPVSRRYLSTLKDAGFAPISSNG